MNGAEVCFVGTLGRDVELRFTPAGRAVGNTSIAVSRRYKKQGEDKWEEETTWWNLTIWGEMAENAASSLVKGTRVFVTGRVQQRNWEDDEGNKRTSLDIVVDEIGPSMRWATCVIERTERSKPTGGGYYEPEEEPF